MIIFTVLVGVPFLIAPGELLPVLLPAAGGAQARMFSRRPWTVDAVGPGAMTEWDVVNLQRTVFMRLYRRAPAVESLPWHREDAPELLKRAVAERTSAGRALDVGCGEGVYAVYLAQHGFSVVAVDFVPAALAAARQRAERAGVEIELHEGDVVDFETPLPFDVVLDSGCLHHLPRNKVSAYRSRLDEWLARGGDYVLVHFAHRPRIPVPKGPNHLTRDEAAALFTPFELQAYDETEFEVPLPMGRMRAGIYWFRRPAG